MFANGEPNEELCFLQRKLTVLMAPWVASNLKKERELCCFSVGDVVCHVMQQQHTKYLRHLKGNKPLSVWFSRLTEQCFGFDTSSQGPSFPPIATDFAGTTKTTFSPSGKKVNSMLKSKYLLGKRDKSIACKYVISFKTYCYRQWQKAMKDWSNTSQTSYTKTSSFHMAFCLLLQRGEE